MLLTEIFLLGQDNIISESKTKGEMVLRGTFQRANEVNQNGRRYKKTILEREVKKLQPIIAENRLLGELDHPQTEQINLSNVAIMVTDLGWDGDDVIGECKLLSTPAGLTAQALIKDGVKLGISSRGLGTLTDIGESVKEVNDDYDMRTFDLVADPSTRGAFPGLMEGVKTNQVGLLIENTKAKALGQRAYVVKLTNLLESKYKTKDKLINEAFNEGKTTGEDPIGTGNRVGAAMYGNDGPEKVAQAKRIGKKIEKKWGNKTGMPKHGYRAKREYQLGKMLGKVKAAADAHSETNEGIKSGQNPVETGVRVGKALKKVKYDDLQKKMDQYSRISSKMKKRHGEFGAGSFSAASQLATRTNNEATAISRKAPGARARLAKHLKSLRRGKSGASDAQISNIAAQSAKADNPQSAFGKSQEFKDTLTHKIGKREYQAKKKNESIGNDPVAAGAKVGTFIKKSKEGKARTRVTDNEDNPIPSPSMRGVTIGNKIARRFSKRYGKEGGEAARQQYIGARRATSKDY